MNKKRIVIDWGKFWRVANSCRTLLVTEALQNEVNRQIAAQEKSK